MGMESRGPAWRWCGRRGQYLCVADGGVGVCLCWRPVESLQRPGLQLGALSRGGRLPSVQPTYQGLKPSRQRKEGEEPCPDLLNER